MTLTRDEMMAALKSIGETSLLMRRPGDWYVHCTAELRDPPGFLTSPTQTGCATPEEAIESAFRDYFCGREIKRG